MSDEWEAYLQAPPTRPRPADVLRTPHEGETMTKLNLDDVKAGLKRLLPIIETVAAITPTPVDNAVVLLLKTLLADEQKLAAAVAETTK